MARELLPEEELDDHPGRPEAGPGRIRLAAAVRELIEQTMLSRADDDDLGRVAEEVRAHAEALAQPAGRSVTIHRYGVAEEFDIETGERVFSDHMPYDVIVGRANPIAPPIRLELDPPKAHGSVVFSRSYEGARGCVHGAIIAAAFDIVLTGANVATGVAGPTVDLSIRYRKPTLIDVETTFEAEVVRIEGRRVTSRGTLSQLGEVRVEAEGTFAVFNTDRLVGFVRPEDAPQVVRMEEPGEG